MVKLRERKHEKGESQRQPVGGKSKSKSKSRSESKSKSKSKSKNLPNE